MNFKPSDIVLLHGDPAVATFEMLEHLFVDLKPELEKAKLHFWGSWLEMGNGRR